jgi:peroxiredoxin Q/BCP
MNHGYSHFTIIGVKSNMKALRVITTITCALAGSACFLSAQSWKAGDKAPDFSAQGNDGKSYTLASVTKKGPAVLYFIRTDCPTNDQALKYYVRIVNAYKGCKVPFIGVINGDLDRFNLWNRDFKVPFPVLLDPDKKIIHSWKAQRSPWVIMVAKDGKIMKEWPGYSNTFLKELSAMIAKGSGVKEKTCDFSGSPTNPRYG